MARPTKYTVPQIIEAIKECNGMVYVTAAKLAVDPATIYRQAEKHPEIQRAIDFFRGHALDRGETKLFDAVEKGEAWAIAFLLKTLGKHRGYYETREEPAFHPDDFHDPYHAIDSRITKLISRRMEEDSRELIN